MANIIAPRVLISLRTSGLFRVLLIFASCSGSMSILKALADDAHSAVPVVRKNSVSVERDGVAVAVGASSPGTGYSEYAAVAVRTTRNESRGFDRER
ncbi:unnamed protein product [Periconia digitata]|uniref:Uncharacterized protein n=1 Tax=Periconia digitata TaxID=1303443 RepID=A0A9W4XL35_9PLEO|nr:unnamed protein product [Periconia digitata]